MIDVCLLLEGTYPYVSGGVSTWVHQLIDAMKDIRFGIVYISPFPDPTRELKYDIPHHVVYYKDIFLHDYNLEKRKVRNPKKKDFELIKHFYDSIQDNDYSKFGEFLKLFQGSKSCLDAPTVFSSLDIWNLMCEFYEKYSPGISLIDYFWTWRGTHLPLIQVLQTPLPSAKVYHSVSTGYAGLLGAIAKQTQNGKFLLTEHGIYTHERMLEISQSSWIYEDDKINYRADKELSYFKKWWIQMFSAMSRICYNHADSIFTLFEENKVREILEGADKEKITIIPNGINVNKFTGIKKIKRRGYHIGLIGRVVSIKDIKTFIQAAKIVLEKNPEAHFYIIGPVDEDADYAQECMRIVEALSLEEKITFTGRVNVDDYYEFLDLVVLTSISEAQPYVILEANICSIPVVATNVGSCRDMLYGTDAASQSLGQSGIITQVSHPEETAEAILKLLEDDELYRSCQTAGYERVKKYYDEDDLLSRYLNVYEQNL